MLKAISRLIDFITWIISFMLVARFVLRFFGARAGAPFVAWLYSATGDLMSPFVGIFPNINLTSGNLVDISAIIAAGVYAIVGYAISAFLDSISDHLEYNAHKGQGPEIAPKIREALPQSYNQPSISEPINPRK